MEITREIQRFQDPQIFPIFSSGRGIWAVERDRHKHIKQASPVPVGHWGTQNARPLEGLPPCCLRHFTNNLQKHKLKARISCQNSSRWDIQKIRWDDPLFIFNLNTNKAMNNYFRGNPSSTTSTKKAKTSKVKQFAQDQRAGPSRMKKRIFCFCWLYLTGINCKSFLPLF